MNGIPPGKWDTYIFRELTGATVGIMGFGFIGQLVAKKLTGFDCNVIACDIAPDYEAAKQYKVSFVSQDELLSQSDFIILLVPLVPSTNELINAETYENGERCGILTASQIIDALEGREPRHRQV